MSLKIRFSIPPLRGKGGCSPETNETLYMYKGFCITLLLTGFLLIPSINYAQEPDPEIRAEESAEVSLEDYTDEFQENFFEALKQKGIENYDRAINLFLECKRLDADNRVIDHELAKVYLKDKQFPLAEDYAIIALNADPENLWYLKTLVDIVQVQSGSFNSVLANIPYENPKLKENLALIYYRSGNYEAARNVLKEVRKSPFSEDLSLKVNDSLAKQEAERKTVSFSTTSNSEQEGSMMSYKMRIEGLFATDSTVFLLQVSEEALEAYPAQPYFYYANGYALNQKGKYREAIVILEAGLDYMLGDISLENKFYTALSDAYKAMNNSVKANMYLRKIKPGF
ncbi:hypothetical protein FGM00_17460 [Aggregatimonas sangjinii]|uniref:Tetratricopeptide repeat protein n=2 Tax=Aggregatimonas sangjinii TaxID=2583587 RepID=A0A5B7ST17_9FLAO|nr:hypothetical protein FGM00_17460 [Aggregatimonas sangjinii]